MAFLSRLFPILYAPSRIYSHRHNHSSSVNSKAINFLHLLKLSSSNENLKPIYSLLIVHGLHGNELLIREFLRSCFHLGSPYLALSVFKRVQKPKLGLQNIVIRGLCKHGLYEQVLCSYLESRLSGCPSDDFTFPSVIKACAALGAVGIARVVHCVVLRTGFEKNVVIQTALVDFYAKSGCMRTARVVIDRIPQPDLVSWNALISGFSLNGRDMEALEVFRWILMMDLKPNLSTFASVLPVCTRLGWFELGKFLHGFAVKSGCFLNDFLIPALISMYAGGKDLCSARKLFDSVLHKDVTVWNAIIFAYKQMEKPVEAFVLFRSMLQNGIRPNLISLVSIIPSCEIFNSKSSGESLHALVIRHGFENQPPVLTTILSMYAKLGDVSSADYIFYQMLNRDRLSWNSMVSGYVYNGLWDLSLSLFCEMQFAGFDPDEVSIVSIVSACSKLGALLLGKSVHGFSVRRGFGSSLTVSNAMLAFYSSCGQLSTCFKLFHEMTMRNAISWNTLISCCVREGEREMAVALLRRMQKEGLQLDLVTLISILPIFSVSKYLGQGMAVHCHTIKSGYGLDISQANALISMYCNCGDLASGKLLFEVMPEKSVVSWNAVMTGFRSHSLHHEVMLLFGRMIKNRQRPNSITLLNLLPACYTQLQGKSIHGFAIRLGILQETPFLTSLIIMYARFDNINLCLLLFRMGKKEDVSLWNAIMSAHIQTKNAGMVFSFFSDLLQMGLEPDNLTVLSLVSGCVQLNSIKLADSVMAYLIRKAFDKEATICNSLIDLQARCGEFLVARKLFDGLKEKDVVSWSVMINGYGLHRDGNAALDLFLQMELSGIKPDATTYSTVLSACNHSGLAEEGLKAFNSMTANNITPKMEHYACLVDLLARTGNLEEAYDMVKRLPCEPSTSLLEALLGACRVHGNVEIGEKMGRKLVDLDPENSRSYVMLYNIYAAAERWMDAERVRSEMEKKGLKKAPGFSLFVGEGFHDKEFG
ncbi:hypothetical protein UlMin_039250 [Ulmus minor]